MKLFVVAIVGAVALILAGTSFAAGEEKTFTGLITDEQLNCIQHPMKVPEQTGDKLPAWGMDACVMYWAHSANPKDKIVLYDPETKTTYHLDSEDLVLPYAGDPMKVKVTGSYDEATKTIHVTRVQP